MEQKYLILDFGKVLAYPVSGHWFITPATWNVLDKNEVNEEKLKQSMKKYNYVLDEFVKTEDEEFITNASSQYGTRGASQAQQILQQTAAMFAGGELTDEDKLAFMHEFQCLCCDSKDRAKKFTPKKFQTDDAI